MTGSENNNDLHDEKLDSLYKRASREKPSAALSRRILDLSRHQANSAYSFTQLVTHYVSQFLRWLTSPAVALATVAVISLGVILKMQFYYPEAVTTPDFNQLIDEEYATPAAPPVTEDSKESESASAAGIMLDEAASDVTGSVSEAAPAIPVEKPADIDRHKAAPKPAKQRAPSSSVSTETDAISAPLEKSEPARRDELKQHYIEAAEQRRNAELKRREIEKKKEREVPRFAEPSMLLQSEPATHDHLSIECSQLAIGNCLNSTACTLHYRDKKYSCETAANGCERNFNQLLDNAEHCESKKGCQFKAGDCKCSNIETCECDNNQPASCSPAGIPD